MQGYLHYFQSSVFVLVCWIYTTQSTRLAFVLNGLLYNKLYLTSLRSWSVILVVNFFCFFFKFIWTFLCLLLRPACPTLAIPSCYVTCYTSVSLKMSFAKSSRVLPNECFSQCGCHAWPWMFLDHQKCGTSNVWAKTASKRIYLQRHLTW